MKGSAWLGTKDGGLAHRLPRGMAGTMRRRQLNGDTALDHPMLKAVHSNDAQSSRMRFLSVSEAAMSQ